MATSKRSARTKKRSSRTTAEPLSDYQRKRDFSKTAEPAGRTGKRTARRSRESDRVGLRFVIQKHDASSLHYDLRLELDGVMRSWAVPKGPSLNPSDKRLAMQVEDHPIEYNTFEGTIPKGEYGGGTVMLWDRGTYSPDEAKRGEDPARAVRRGLEGGKLSFTFHGERLHGSFALVRTDRGARPKWLLIKHRDEEATDTVDITEEVRTSVETGRTMEEITAEADRVWRSNRGDSPGGEEPGTAAAPSSAAGMIAPMRPKPARAVPADGEWTFELWRGGARVLAYVAGETAVLMDERGTDVTKKHRAIADELISLAGRLERPFVLDGEIAPAARSGSGSRSTPKAADGNTFHAADLLLEGDDVLMDEEWSSRRASLEALLRRRRLKQVALQQTGTRAETLLRRAAREGWPGILARRTDAPYRPGTRSDALRRIPVH